MDTVANLISKAAEAFKANAGILLTQHSQLERDPDDGIVKTSGNYHWLPLDVVGCQVQSRLNRDFEYLTSILRVLLCGETPTVRDQLAEKARSIASAIEQEGGTWSKTIDNVVRELSTEVDSLVGLVSSLYDDSENSCIYVPDTNALLYNPNLEEWSFDGSPCFMLILTPAVLSELDQLKVNHRNESVRQKAEGLIRRVKGYRTRGRLTEGVTLRSGRSTLKTLAIEPDMSQTLPWLKVENTDDRILATFIEVMRRHPRCSVALVTRDINLQNKAEFARLLFVEPPEPVEAEESTTG